MSVAEVAKKIKRTIGPGQPVLVLIRATPAALSATVRCQPVNTPPDVLEAKFKGWCRLGVYTHDVPLEWLEDDIEFAIQLREIYVQQC